MFKKIFSLHSWLGLWAGLLILVISVSGSLLLFAPEMEAFRIRNLVKVSPEMGSISPDQAISNVYHHFKKGSMVKGLIMPRDQTTSYMLWVRDEADHKWKRVYMHPDSGEILGAVSQDQAFDRWLVHLHYNLTAGKWGLLIVSLAGLILLASSASGVYVYYKMFRSVKLRKIRRHKRLRIMTTDTHNLLGMISLPFIILITCTGLWIIIPFIPHFFETSESGGESYEFPKPGYEVSELVEKVKGEYPEFKLTAVWFPEHAAGNIELSGTDENQGQKIRVHFEFDSGDLIAIDGPTPKKLQANSFNFGDLIEKIHFGEYGGLLVKIVYSFFGIIPGLLAVTGFFSWYLKKNFRS